MIGLLDTVAEQQVIHRLGWTLLHTLWAVTVVAVALGGMLLILRRGSANARYLGQAINGENESGRAIELRQQISGFKPAIPRPMLDSI